VSDEGFKKAVSGSLSLQLDRQDDTVFARLHGELDIAAEDALDEVFTSLFTSSPPDSLIVDLRGVSFVDSSGLRILLKQEMRSRRDGFDFGLIPPGGPAMRALEVAGVHRLIGLRTPSGTEISEGAKAAERASAGLGTDDKDPADWLSPPGEQGRPLENEPTDIP
jgi:anti-sigma B factor antagonist